MSRIAIAPARFPHETAFLDALAVTLRGLGHTVYDEWAELDFAPFDLLVKWGGMPNDMVSAEKCLYIECGWLPRWSYQVSWSGINAKHHAAGGWRGLYSPLNGWAGAGTAGTYIEGIQRHFRTTQPPPQFRHYADYTTPAWEGLAPFYLCPLQVPTDVNMASLPEDIRTPEGMIDEVLATQAAGLLDPIRIYFKGHPAMSERRKHYRLRPPHKYLKHTPKNQIAAFLKSPQCRGVVVGNSNVFHDALLWGKPALALGAGFWGAGPVTMEPGTDETNAYLRHVLANQWSLANASDPGRVAQLLEGATE